MTTRNGITTRQVCTVGGVTLLTAAIGYCFYFDYKRRNDPVFRRKLQREHRKLHKARKTTAAREDEEIGDMLRSTVEALRAEPPPTTVEAKEAYFMEQVSMGEMLAQRLPQGAMPAAIAFFKGYKMYPQPQELLMVYQRTVPPEVFGILMEMVKVDVAISIGGSASGSSSGSRRGPSGDAILEEIPADERPSSSTSTKPKSSSSSGSSPTDSSKKGPPSTTSSASGNGNSFVLVDEGSTAVPASSVGAPATEASEKADGEKVESLTSSLISEAEPTASLTEGQEKIQAESEALQQEPLS